MIDLIKYYSIKNKCKKGLLPTDICDYIKRYSLPFNKNQSIDEIRFVVLDTETTGLNIKKDKIIQIGAVTVQDNKILIQDSMDVFVKWKELMMSDSIKIHGFLPSDLNSGLEIGHVLIDFLKFVRADVIVAHHAAFDIGMFNKFLQECFSFKLFNRVVDTGTLAIRLEQSQNDHHNPNEYTLDALCKRYKVPIENRHTAISDAYITAILFLKLLKSAKQRGITTIGQLVH